MEAKAQKGYDTGIRLEDEQDCYLSQFIKLDCPTRNFVPSVERNSDRIMVRRE